MAFKKINSYLSSRGGIGTSIETLEAQLLENELIRKTDSGRISFADGKKLNGVEWNGEPLTCL